MASHGCVMRAGGHAGDALRGGCGRCPRHDEDDDDVHDAALLSSQLRLSCKGAHRQRCQSLQGRHIAHVPRWQDGVVHDKAPQRWCLAHEHVCDRRHIVAALVSTTYAEVLRVQQRDTASVCGVTRRWHLEIE